MRYNYVFAVMFILLAIACEGDKEHTAAAINDEDSIAFMRSKGISTLISDSGVIKYRLVAEEWDIYNEPQPPTWKFMKGFFMERYDKTFNVDLHVLADTAYLHNQRTWELRGRVYIKNAEGTIFQTEELFWDLDEHKMWNHQFMHITTPERELTGTDFRSNEEMTDYYVSNSTGSFPAKDTESKNEEPTMIAPTLVDQASEDQSPASAPNTKSKPTATSKKKTDADGLGHWK